MKEEKKGEVNLSESLKELNGITDWFDSEEGIGEIETALSKVQRAAEIIKVCNKKLTEIENKFEEIQRDLDSELNPEDGTASSF
jgi:exonuclease VII small subunit